MEDFTFQDVCHRIYTTMQHRKDAPEWEDAVQEGYIQAWKDWENGSREFWYLVNRGRTWSKAYLQRANGRRATGHTRVSREGVATKSGTVTREKVRMFLDEYRSIHGCKPTGKVVAAAIGISEGYAHHTMANLEKVLFASKQGTRENHIVFPMDHTRMDSSGVDEAMSPEFARGMTVPDFSESILSDGRFFDIVSHLPERYCVAITMYYYFGCPTQEIGEHLGMSRQSAVNLLVRARSHVRKYLNESTD